MQKKTILCNIRVGSGSANAVVVSGALVDAVDVVEPMLVVVVPGNTMAAIQPINTIKYNKVEVTHLFSIIHFS